MPTTNKSLVQQVYNTSTGNLPADQVVDPTYISTPYPNWSIPINYDLGAMDLALGGLVTISVTGLLVNQTMVLSQYQPMTIVFSGTLSANIKYSLPATVGGTWIVYNNTTGAFTLSMGSPTGPTTVAIPAGGPYNVTCNSASGIAFVNGYNAANSITTAMIQTDAITTLKILDGNITYAKLAAAVQALLVPTGTLSPYAGSTAPTGWLLASGLTIGNATSNGTARANADTQTLFELLWNSFSNTELPIYTSAGAVSTRGASATADFTANKQLALPDLRGRAVAGKDNMGGTSANRLTGLSGGVDGDILGASGGLETHTLTEAQIASHYHLTRWEGTSNDQNASPSSTKYAASIYNPGNANDAVTGYTTNVANVARSSSTGGGGAHNNVQPTFILNYIIKL